jgi:hypothetical protein
MQKNPKSQARSTTESDDATHFTVQQLLVLIMIVWMVVATILPVVSPDPAGAPTPHQTIFADLAPSLLADERINNDG